jgi:rubrerythrin
MTTMKETTRLLPRWWEDPTWQITPWTCPRCGTETPGTPPVGTPCPRCGYRESGD